MNRLNQFAQEYIKLCEEFGYFIHTNKSGDTDIYNMVEDGFIYDDQKLELKIYLGDN